MFCSAMSQRTSEFLVAQPCADTPAAATAAVTTGGEALQICKDFLFVSLLPLAVRGSNDTPPIVTVTRAAVGVSPHVL